MSEAPRDRIRRFVTDNFLFGRADAMPADDASLQGRGVLDSTGVLELIEFLEREFGIAVPDADLLPQNLDSVDRLVAYVERRRGG
jgi:acyl carrier protein